jgi:methionyl-tRNA formyltransferase
MELKIVFMGSPDFALPSLSALAQSFRVVGVVTQPDQPAGRGRKLRPPEVKILAEALGLPILQPRTLRDPETLEVIRRWSPDVIVVAAFGQILRGEVLRLPPFGCINVHASLLPRWRGASPVQAAVLHDDISGVTIMKMDKGLDTGPILSQSAIPIDKSITAGELFNELAQMGADLLVDTLPKFVSSEIKPQTQDDEQATYAHKLSKEDGQLDFSKPADFLARMVRAYNPWPGAFQFFNGTRLKVFKAHSHVAQEVIPAKRYIVDEKPAWGTSDGLLVLDEVQLEGKSRVKGRAFLNGAKNWVQAETGE